GQRPAVDRRARLAACIGGATDHVEPTSSGHPRIGRRGYRRTGKGQRLGEHRGRAPAAERAAAPDGGQVETGPWRIAVIPAPDRVYRLRRRSALKLGEG